VLAVESRVITGVMRCMLKMAAGIGFAVLNKPPEMIVLKKNNPAITMADTSIIFSFVIRLIWLMVMNRKTIAASEISLWIVKMIVLIGFPAHITQNPEKQIKMVGAN
jgi:hypothetical protein